MRILALLLALLAAASLSPGFAQTGDDAPLRFGRYEHQGAVHYGMLATGGVHELDRNFLDSGVQRTGKVLPLAEVKLLAPVVPSKLLGVAFNYPGQAGDKPDPLPGFFAKLPTSVTSTEAPIAMPFDSTSLHFEGEMVVVIGKRARNVAEAAALDHVFGVTAGNDVTERGYGFSPIHVVRIKGQDTFAPLGPWVVPGLAIGSLKLRTRLNGEVVQQGSTREMTFPVAKLIAFLSRYVTLEPGDVIFTGTPGKTRPMKAGDVVEVELEGVGVLRNRVEAAK